MEALEDTKVSDSGTFACTSCGADLKYKPGTTNLACDYCGAQNEIPVIEHVAEELDLHAYLNDASSKEESITIHAVHCKSCGATSTLGENAESGSCPYCDNPIVVSEIHDEKVIRPKSVLPFKLDKQQAHGKFKDWIKSLWFAPGNLKKASLSFDHFKGIYIPYWTYDSSTASSYIGQRGEYYYVTQSVNKVVDGKNITEQQQVRKVRWHNVNGHISHVFDDVLVPASKSLPVEYIDKLEPWDLTNMEAFKEEFLSGYITEKYQVDLETGFGIAKVKMEDHLRLLAKQDIGGDEQRIITLNTNYSNITFKHILLPIYVSAYRFKGKVYQFLVNGRTGEVQGERPWSWLKIAGLVLIVLGAIFALWYAKNG